MNWKQYLESKGFKWSCNNSSMIKSLPFGNRIEVSMDIKGLFEIKKYGKIEYSHFIESFSKFKSIVDHIIDN